LSLEVDLTLVQLSRIRKLLDALGAIRIEKAQLVPARHFAGFVPEVFPLSLKPAEHEASCSSSRLEMVTSPVFPVNH
jgi:hypothetical protein